MLHNLFCRMYTFNLHIASLEHEGVNFSKIKKCSFAFVFMSYGEQILKIMPFFFFASNHFLKPPVVNDIGKIILKLNFGLFYLQKLRLTILDILACALVGVSDTFSALELQISTEWFHCSAASHCHLSGRFLISSDRVDIVCKKTKKIYIYILNDDNRPTNWSRYLSGTRACVPRRRFSRSHTKLEIRSPAGHYQGRLSRGPRSGFGHTYVHRCKISAIDLVSPRFVYDSKEEKKRAK